MLITVETKETGPFWIARFERMTATTIADSAITTDINTIFLRGKTLICRKVLGRAENIINIIAMQKALAL